MHEQAALSRRSLAAFPLAALIRPPSAAHVAPCPADADAELLVLGRRWQAACAALHENDLASFAVGGDERGNSQIEAEEDRLFREEQQLFDELMAMQPCSLQGLAFKAHALARAHDVLSPDRAALKAAAASTWDLEASSALIVALDILRLAERGT